MKQTTMLTAQLEYCAGAVVKTIGRFVIGTTWFCKIFFAIQKCTYLPFGNLLVLDRGYVLISGCLIYVQVEHLNCIKLSLKKLYIFQSTLCFFARLNCWYIHTRIKIVFVISKTLSFKTARTVHYKISVNHHSSIKPQAFRNIQLITQINDKVKLKSFQEAKSWFKIEIHIYKQNFLKCLLYKKKGRFVCASSNHCMYLVLGRANIFLNFIYWSTRPIAIYMQITMFIQRWGFLLFLRYECHLFFVRSVHRPAVKQNGWPLTGSWWM